jgi:tetratricopeptide repeat protein
MLGPDHPTTLGATTALTLALVQLGEADPARTLAEDTLRRSRRVLGPDHPITLIVAATLTDALVRLGEAEPARALAEDTLRRCRRTLGPDHLIARYLAWVAVTDLHLLSDDAAADDPSPPR